MDWKDRLHPGISLLSPEGTRFEAKWSGDDISIEKRVSRHAHPDQDGETAQDLGLNSPDYPLTIFFDGIDHDITARRFMLCMAERGVWQVLHPVYGALALQPVKITVKVQPVESGNITEISGDWFVPAGEIAVIKDLSAVVKEAVTSVNEAALSDVSRIKRNALAAAASFKKGYAAVKQFVRTANDRITGILETVNDYSTRAVLEIASISGAVIQLIESPGLFIGNCASRISMFTRLGRQILTDLPAAWNFTYGKISAALSSELWLSAITAGMGLDIISGPPETRPEALFVLEQYRDFTVEARNALDALSAVTAANPIESQYVPGSASTEALLQLQASVARYLLTAAYDLKAERRIILERPRTPIEIVINELGADAGNVDMLYADFCRWNDLHGKRLLLLNAGDEAVLYA